VHRAAYKNHPGHYEVVLIEYDPTKTSYELLVEYAYRNLDPFDGNGQFCDKGASYHPAIFFATEEEQLRAEEVLAEILELYPDWSEESIKVPILERPKFWKGACRLDSLRVALRRVASRVALRCTSISSRFP